MRLLDVDLDSGTCSLRDIEEDLVRHYIGGRGLNTKLLFDSAPERTAPLSAAYPIVFGTGPLTGTPFPMSGRFEATSKSPLTGTISTSSCGGRLGVYLRKCGIHVLSIRGAAQAPAYLYVDKGKAEILDAGDLWSREKSLVKRILKERHGNDISIALIGKAGEKGVLFANIENDGRFLGRGGLGAILGAKQLKAIVVKGKGRVEVPNKEELSFLAYECRKWLSANPITAKGLPEFGTGILLNYMREVGLLSSRNFRVPAPFESSGVSGEMVTSTILKKRRACPFCQVACGRVNAEGEGPEYETLWALGVNLSIFDIGKVLRLNNLCNELGLDTISTGSTIGMAAELSETGKLPFSVNYGDFEGTLALVGAIGERQGPGEILSLGAKRLGEACDADDLAVHVKGLELPAYDPAGAYGNALGYATSNRGGCHMQGYLVGAEILGIPKMIDRYAIEGKATILSLYQNVAAFMDSLVMCRFSSLAVPHDYYARIASAATGSKMSWEEAIRTGERIWNLERLFNLREGVEPDRLPERFSQVPLGPMLREYFQIRGWNEGGRPTDTTLHRLGLL